MHFSHFLLAALAVCVGQSLAAPTPIKSPSIVRRSRPVHPGTAKDIIITSTNTVNATGKTNGTVQTQTRVAAGSAILPLSFKNNFPGNIFAYVTGLDVNNNLVMLQPNGQWYYPQAPPPGYTGAPIQITANVAIPVGGQGSNLNINIPGYISAARVWLANGNLNFYTVRDGNGNPSLVEPSAANPNDPSAGVNWGFVELTWSASGIFANISYVDFVGLILSMSLSTTNGLTQFAGGLQSNAVNTICQALAAQGSRDSMPWGDLCMADAAGNNLRVTAPVDYIATNPSAWSGYYDNYINQVWQQYSTQPLTIDTQNGYGKVACTVSGDLLSCAGDNRAYAKPTVADIWGCNSGPFAIWGTDNDIHRAVVPRLCAAFVRTTLLVNGGNVQPSVDSSNYYLSDPTDWYSAFVHQVETNGIGYAFSYDDVNPGGENESGAVSDGAPSVLAVTIG